MAASARNSLARSRTLSKTNLHRGLGKLAKLNSAVPSPPNKSYVELRLLLTLCDGNLYEMMSTKPQLATECPELLPIP